jgi:hypothetical protein
MARALTDKAYFTFRIRENLRRRLEKAAQRSGTSMNIELAARLEASFQNEDLVPVLNALVAKEARAGGIVADMVTRELRALGIDHAKVDEVAGLIRAYMGEALS